MAQLPMYLAKANSPVTAIAAPGINASVTTIPVADGTLLPAAPNIVTVGNHNNSETILYTGKNGNNLTGCIRGFQGTAQSWAAGSEISRLFTAYDHDTFKSNIEDITKDYATREATASLIRNSIPSGIVNLDTSWSATAAKSLTTAENRASLVNSLYSTTVFNAFQIKNFVAFINGYEVQVKKDTDAAIEVILNAPPTSGVRDDLVFLEAWFVDKAVGDNIYKYGKNGGTVERLATYPERVLEWRIRVVDGVDFTTYPEGFHKNTTDKSATAFNVLVTPQGGRSTPVVADVSSELNCMRTLFCPVNVRGLVNMPNVAIGDSGLYVAGDGSSSKITLSTADGYVYAVPLCKVRRRNNAGYSAANPCGARDFITNTLTISPSLSFLYTKQLTVTSDFYAAVKVDDYLGLTTSLYKALKVISKDGSNLITVQNVRADGYSADSGTYCFISDRPTGLYSNIIDQSDITWLAHRVSLTGFNETQLLNEVRELLFTNGLTTNKPKTMLKNYHGLPKSVIDEYTACYFSGESLVAEKGTLLTNISSEIHKPCATGNGIYLADGKYIGCSIPAGQTAITIDDWFNTEELWANAASGYMRLILGENTVLNVNGASSLGKMPTTDAFVFYIPGGSNINFTAVKPKSQYTHVRIIHTGTNIVIKFNGIQVATGSTTAAFNSSLITYIMSGSSAASYGYQGASSDFHVSLTDRGTSYPQFEGGVFPADISQGYARVAPAFTNQHTQYADPVTGQYTNSVAKADDIDHDLGISRGTVGVGTKQVETATVVGSVTTPGNAIVTVTSANMGGSPKVIPVAVALNDTADLVAGKIRTALSLDPDVKSTFDISGTGANIVLTNKARLANDPTLNIAIQNGTCAGLTDALTSANTTAGVAGVWSQNDTVKVKGVAGEIISGVIDADTAICTLVENTSGVYAKVSSVVGITANDVFKWRDNAGVVGGSNITVVAVDTATNTLTLDNTYNLTSPGTFHETTASSSVPVVKANIAGTVTTINGTWATLGTNEAQFTLGSNPTLTNQDLYIEYSLNCYAGQGALTELATEVLQAEVKGKKLRPFVSGTTPFVTDDFANKVANSTVECPHTEKRNYTATALLTPSSGSWSENSQGGYDSLRALDGSVTSVQNVTNGGIAQELISKNLIRIVEDKYGPIPAVDKVQYLKDNVSKIIFNAWVKGDCPVAGVAGNVAALKTWSNSSLSWNVVAQVDHPNAVITKLQKILDSGIANLITVDGLIHFLVFTGAADGTTSPTTIRATAHGLVTGDLVYNVGRGAKGVVTKVDDNHLSHSQFTSQAVGDIVKKYQKQANGSVGSVSDGTTFIMAAHGLNTGDFIRNTTNGNVLKQVTVVGQNTLVIDDTTGFVAGDTIEKWIYFEDDLCEAGIASTIYTDYCNIEVELKTSHLTALGYEVLVPDNPRRDDWVVVTDDLAGKIAGSLVGVSHYAKKICHADLQVPSAFTDELTTAEYAAIATDDTSYYSVTTSVAGERPQLLIAFDVIKEYEDTHGPIPKTTRKAKAQWLRENCRAINNDWYGYGSCPSGYKAKVKPWSVVSSVWTDWSGSIPNNSVALISTPGLPPTIIDDKGYVYFLAYTDASDGVTPSTITTDYVKLILYMKPRINPIIIRKDTKEIQTYFPAKTGRAVSWINYIPYQGLTPTVGNFFQNDPIVSDIQAFMSTIGTGAWTNTPYSNYKGLSSRLPINVGKDYDLIGQDITVNSLLSKLLKVDLVPQGYSTYELGQLNKVVSSVISNTNRGVDGLIAGLSGLGFIALYKAKTMNAITGKCQNIMLFIVYRKTDNKLYLVVVTNTSYSNNQAFTPASGTYNASCDIYELPGRPLLKM